MNNEVHVWEEDITLPTYATGEPEKNPMFLEKRVYQGSSAVVRNRKIIDKKHWLIHGLLHSKFSNIPPAVTRIWMENGAQK